MIHLQGIVRTKFPLHSSKAKGKEGEKFQFPTDVEKQAVQPWALVYLVTRPFATKGW
jgi:hypothetical protein